MLYASFKFVRKSPLLKRYPAGTVKRDLKNSGYRFTKALTQNVN